MGIRGLTTFVAKNGLGERATKTLTYPIKANNTEERKPLVVDGSALFYHVFFQSGDWVHGGNFIKFAGYIRAYIRVLQVLGFDLHVLVDGGVPDGKMATTTAREAEKIRRIVKVQRAVMSGDTSYRTTDGFMPSLAYFAALQVLREEKVWFRVCWSEADGIIATLARSLGASVLSKDSDFFIFDIPSYIPLYDLEIPKPLLNMFWNDESPVEYGTEFNVQWVSFVPGQFATFMNFGIKSLPIMAALTGNDYEQVVEFVDAHIKKQISASTLSPHDRIREVSAILQKYPEGPCVEEVSRLIAGNDEEVYELITKAITNANQHYLSVDITDFDAEGNSHAVHKKAETDFDKRVLKAFEQGNLPYSFINVLTESRLICSVRLTILDAQSPWISTRAIRLFIIRQISMASPSLLNQSGHVEEFLRRGYNFNGEPVGYSIDEIISLHQSFSDLPHECILNGSEEERLLAFSILTDTRMVANKEINLGQAAALRLMINACNLSRSTISPRIADYELSALVVSVVYAKSARVIMKPPVPVTDGKQKKQMSHKTTYTPRGILRAAYWATCLEHVLMLIQVLRLDVEVDGSWVTEAGCLDVSSMTTAFQGPLFHFLLERLKSGAKAETLLESAGLDTTSYTEMLRVVSEGLDAEIEKVFVDKAQRKKNKKNKENEAASKSNLKTSNPFELLEIS